MEIRKLENKCDKCGRCVRDCAAGVWRDVDGVPTPVAPELCNLCSHCLAVCPHSAVEHDLLDHTQIHHIKENLIEPDIYREIVLTRRSVRHYKKKPVSRETIEQILDLARYSPTASNTQNVQYTVVTDADLMRRVSRRIFGLGKRANKWFSSRRGKLLLKAFEKTDFGKSFGRYIGVMEYYKDQTEAGRDYILHNAPVLILVHAPARTNFSCDNCNIAAVNITNYAHSLGLATCYIGFITMALRFDRTMRSWFDIPKGQKVFASLVLGYPAYSHTFTVSRKKPEVRWISA